MNKMEMGMGMGLPPQAPEQEDVEANKSRELLLDANLARLKQEVSFGRVSIEQVQNLIHPGKLSETKLKGSKYGYDTVVEIGGEIVCLKGQGVTELYKGKEIEAVGDSKGYAGGLNPGDKARIIKFNDPNEETSPVYVRTDDGRVANLKLKEIK